MSGTGILSLDSHPANLSLFYSDAKLYKSCQEIMIRISIKKFHAKKDENSFDQLQKLLETFHPSTSNSYNN